MKVQFRLIFSIIFFSISANICIADSVDLENYQALTSDANSFRVGEPITILVLEASSAESSAMTDSGRDVSIKGRAADNTKNVSAGLGIESNNNGAGATERKGRVTTQLTTRIIEVLPMGMYRVEGKHNLIVNGEHQTISVSGLIKAKDLNKDNAIMSYKLADASIEIVGAGDVSRAQKQNIIYRTLSWLGLL